MCAMFFFFQAEDGIRDGHVTGVQTCALPISIWLSIAVRSAIMPPRSALRLGPDRWYEGGLVGTYQPPPRSDDRDRKSVVQGKSEQYGARRLSSDENKYKTEQKAYE